MNTLNLIKIKIFVGCHFTSEIKMLLSQSTKWKHDKIGEQMVGESLSEVHYHGRDYLGYFIEKEQLTIDELKQFEQTVEIKLADYCPNFNMKNIQHCLFAQVFVA